MKYIIPPFVLVACALALNAGYKYFYTATSTSVTLVAFLFGTACTLLWMLGDKTEEKSK